MRRRFLPRDWTQEDRLTRAKWMRGVAIFYGCAALLLLGVIAIIKPSNVTPNGFTDRKVWTAESHSAKAGKTDVSRKAE